MLKMCSTETCNNSVKITIVSLVLLGIILLVAFIFCILLAKNQDEKNIAFLILGIGFLSLELSLCCYCIIAPYMWCCCCLVDEGYRFDESESSKEYRKRSGSVPTLHPGDGSKGVPTLYFGEKKDIDRDINYSELV